MVELLKSKIKEIALNKEIVNRLKSLIWRSCAFCSVGLLALFLEAISTANVSNTTIVFVSLIVSEVTKFLNNKYGLKK